MKTLALAAATLALTACSGESEVPAPPLNNNEATPAAEVPPPPPPPTAEAKAVKESDDFIEFTYGWPAEAAALPALASRLESELERDKAEALATAREDKEARGEEFPFHGHYFSKEWKRLGDTPRLLSLAAEVGTFTGGAHGNSVYDSILWDREANQAIETDGLFTDPAAAFAAMNEAYCGALDRQRAKKREASLPLEGEGWMVECPPLAKQVVVPVDGNEDRRFEMLRILIAPYEAGPYAEGSYEVDVPVTDAVRGLIKPEYRAVF
jgi:hypothetical protein